MKLGFLGTGEITSAIVTGLSTAGGEVSSIRLSPRNGTIAADLARRFPGVSIASSNQDVLDCCDTIVVAVRPQVARSALSELRFRPEHRVIGVVSALSLRVLSELVRPATHIARAVPLPSTAKRIGPTAIYPSAPEVESIFAKVGTALPVQTEQEFDAICAATATIASFYAYVEEIAAWLSRNGVAERKAREYVARMFFGVISGALDSPERSFRSLADAHATAGGINEKFLRHLIERGLLASVPEGLDAIMGGARGGRDS